MNQPVNGVRLADDGGWIGIFGKIAPILGGVGSFGSLINSVIAAQRTAQFQEQLISTLQDIERTLEGIKNDLDAIYQELKNIEQDIEGLGLNDKLTAIDTWSMNMAALDPTDTHGAQMLATAMLKASQGTTNLLACMTGLHNAMVGESIGTPLINLVDPPSFLRLRARLVRGLQLLAFATAFNIDEKYDYGVFLLDWAANFQQQTELYFAAGKDPVVLNGNHYGGSPDLQLSGGDTVAIFRYAQPALSNVAISLLRPAIDTLVLYPSATLSWYTMSDLGFTILGFTDIPADATVCYVDLKTNQATTDLNSPLAKAYDGSSRWLVFWVDQIEFNNDEYTPVTALVCGARYNPAQTFLGGVNGQLHWLEAAGDRSSFVSSIHDGFATDAPLVTYDANAGTCATMPFAALHGLTEALWTTSWVGADVIAITALHAATAAPVYLGIGPDGTWQVSAAKQVFQTAVPPEIPVPMTNPLTMPPTNVTVLSSMGGQKPVLFRQF